LPNFGVAVSMGCLAIVSYWNITLPRSATHQPSVAEPPRQRFALYRVPTIVLLAGITALAFLCEGTLETRSAIYLRSVLDLPAVLGAAGPAVFHAAMLIGWLGTGRIVGRFGRRTLLQAAGALAASGMVLALATTIPPLILLGLLIAGLALAGVAPIAFSLAGDFAPQQAGAVSSLITTVGYSGFLIGPALIGGLAEVAGLRMALATIIVVGGLIIGLSLWVDETGRRAP
jgi:predicted MFS family arabinose efflux permease